MFVSALALVLLFNLDVVATLINAYHAADGLPANASGFWSKVISALILGGGSAGIFNILVALGFRDRQGLDAPKPPGPEHAWLAIRVTGHSGDAPKIQVKIGRLNPPPADPPQPLAGTMRADRPRIKDLLFLAADRWPVAGGYTLEANVCYKIEVCAGERNLLKGNGIYVFAPRAIVDLEVPYTDA